MCREKLLDLVEKYLQGCLKEACLSDMEMYRTEEKIEMLKHKVKENIKEVDEARLAFLAYEDGRNLRETNRMIFALSKEYILWSV